MRLIIFVVLTVTVATAVPIEKIARKILGTAGFCFSLGHCSPVLAKVDDPKAMQRWQDAYTELQNLDKNWDKIVNDNRSGTNGDNIRRKLGTVYTPPTCESPLCSFSSFVNKFVKANYEDIDLPAFDTASASLLEALNQADFLAYSSVFSDYGNGGNSEEYLTESKNQVKRALSSVKDILDILAE